MTPSSLHSASPLFQGTARPASQKLQTRHSLLQVYLRGLGFEGRCAQWSQEDVLSPGVSVGGLARPSGLITWANQSL